MPDDPASKEEMFNVRLKEHFIMQNEVAENEDIEVSLKTLEDYDFIYRTEESGISKYAIKAHNFLVFTFAPEFAGEMDHEEEKPLRESIMTNNTWKLFIALRYDQAKKYAEPVLEAIKKEKLEISTKRFLLFTAAEHSTNAENIKLLVDYLKIRIDMQDKDGETAFLRAAENNPNQAIIEWFLDNLRKKEIFKKNQDGFNAFENAVLFNTNLEILRILADKGKFVPHKQIRLKTFSMPAYTPFLLSLETNTDLEFCNYFIDDLHCDVNELFYLDVRGSFNNQLLDENLDTENKDYDNIKEFRKFVRSNRKVIGKKLKHAAHFPVLSALLNPNIKILEKVLASGVDIERVKKYCGEPLLHLAAKLSSRPECLNLLKKYGCKVLERSNNGLTALHRAALFNSSIPVFDWFIKNHIDTNIVGDDGFTAFDVAVEKNPHQEVIEWFIEHASPTETAEP
jgi:ankyrin repeat protein